jgi:glycosyltransferase involved in cell wall biosynthesis/2-polyprenyl-3-methyl-5-hydroxy-6-metoxy-1,4-benzoquinol methylase
LELGNAKENSLFIKDSKIKYFAKADDIDPQVENNSLSHIIKAITDASIVLDVGCSYGYLGEWLVENKNCEVYGIDISNEALEYVKNKGYYKDVFNLDLDYPQNTKDEFERFKQIGEIFDFVVCADVLEHLKNPTTALEFVSSKLKIGAQVLVSIPNIAHMDIVLNLLESRFNYSEYGILDNTHLRFFTKRSFAEWIKNANQYYKTKNFQFDLKHIGYTIYISDFQRQFKTNHSDLYTQFLTTNPELEILQHIFALTKLNPHANPYNLDELLNSEPYQNIMSKIYTQIKTLKDQISDKHKIIEDLSSELSHTKKSLQKTTEEFNLQLNEKNEEIIKLMSELSHFKSLVQTLESEKQQYSNHIAEIYKSRGYKMILKYYKIRDTLLPINTKRRKIVKFIGKDILSLSKKSLQHIKQYGFKSFFNKMRMKLNTINSDLKIYEENKNINIPQILLPDIKEEELIIFDDIDISVIIPTKNAGEEFEHLIKILKKQKGFNSIEIVIVDSGSSDNTVNIAREYNAKVINILPEKFSHSYARNIGAENASGNYLFFTVQDALPPNDKFLYNLMTIQKNYDVVAVSCAEIPREDSDLFYRVICWNHYNFLGVNGNNKILKMPKTVNHITLRQNGQLSDIACLISREKFVNYKYRGDYAEDLDLGIRLIKDGNKIAFLGSTRIIHSHNRPAYYFLKRGYVDNLFLPKMFDDYPIPKINYNDFVSDIIFGYNFIKEIIIKEIPELDCSLRTEELGIIIKEKFQQAFKFTYPENVYVDDNKYIDEEFKIFFKNVFLEQYKKKGEVYSGFLINSLLDFSNITFEYLNNTYEVVDEFLIEDLKVCLYKEYALLCGAHLAYCYLNCSQDEKQKLKKFMKNLKKEYRLLKYFI